MIEWAGLDWGPKIWLFFPLFRPFFSIFFFPFSSLPIFVLYQTNSIESNTKRKSLTLTPIPIYCCNIISLGLPKHSTCTKSYSKSTTYPDVIFPFPFPFPTVFSTKQNITLPYFFYDFGSLIVFSPDNTTQHISLPFSLAQQKKESTW